MERDDVHRTRTSFSQLSGKDSSSDGFPDDNSCIDSNAYLKRSRLDRNEQHNLGDSYITFPSYFLQEQGASSSHHGKEHYLWNNMSFDDKLRSGVNIDSSSRFNERECDQFARPNVVSHHDLGNPGELNERSMSPSKGNCFDFLQTSNTNGDCRSSSMPALNCHNSAALMPEFTAAESSTQAFLSGAHWQSNNFLSPLEESSDGVQGKASVPKEHHLEQSRFARVNADNMSGNSSYSFSAMSPVLPSQREIDEQSLLFHGSSSRTQCEGAMSNGRKFDLKRKFSTTDTDLSLAGDSQSTGWTMNQSTQDEIGSNGQTRPLSRPFAELSNASHPSIQVWDHFPENRTSVASSHLCIDHVHNNSDVISTSGVHPDGCLRPLEDHQAPSVAEQHESQLRSQVGRNFRKSTGSLNAPGSYTDDPGSSDTINGQSSICHGMSSTSSNMATCGVMNHYNRQEMIPRYFVRESTSIVNDRNRVNGVTNRFARGVRRAVLNNSGHHAISDQIPDVSVARMTNALEAGNPFQLPHGSVHTTLPYGQTSTATNGSGASMLPIVSNHPALAISVRFPRTSSVQLPAGHAASLVDGRRGAISQRARSQNILGLPMGHSRMALGDRRRLISEILNTLQHTSRNGDINFEDVVMLDPSFIYQGIDVHDQHSDLRLDIDNMSYEELLALGERIGDVNTGLTNEMITACLRESKYSPLDAKLATVSSESDAKCSICQEEFVEDDKFGQLDCGHGYHTFCIKQWLLLKNLCPICKASAYSK